MTSPQESDSAFVGSVPEFYDRFLVPLIFETYADNLVRRAMSAGTAAPVVSQRANASFDAAVCQFGVMLFPDKVAAHAEVARVLRRGGTYLFSVRDQLEANEFAHEIEHELAALYPDNPPTFMSCSASRLLRRRHLRACS